MCSGYACRVIIRFMLAFLTTIFLTCPLNSVDGTPLSSEPLVAVVYLIPEEVLTSEVCWPGEEISQELPVEYGCFFARAWLIDSLLSGDSNTVCNKDPGEAYIPPCMDCHSTGL